MKRFGRLEKGSYLCSPQGGQRSPRSRRGGLKDIRVEKILQKDLEESEKVFTFAPLSAEKTVDGREVKTDSEPREETGIVLIAI